MPKDLNDNCYNLEELNKNEVADTIVELIETKHNTDRINIITSFLYNKFQEKQNEIDFDICKAIQHIIGTKGQLMIKDVYNELHLSERTFERRFFNEVGVTAKQFSKIIQFQQSLHQLTLKDYTKLTDIVYANGFADQSHFIKVFKAFTGKTPIAFKAQN